MEVADLSKLLSLNKIDELTYHSIESRKNVNNALFGGQVLGQALAAALDTVKDRPAHSLHAYFLRAGSTDSPVEYQVELSRDGGSMSARRVNAIQSGKSIFNLAASFHAPEPGFEHQREPIGNIPRPEELDTNYPAKPGKVSIQEKARPNFLIGIEFKDIGAIDFRTPVCAKPEHSYWIRATETLSDDYASQQSALAYISDMRLIGSALLPHKSTIFDKEIMVASVDHALWFHRHDFNVNEWMLFQVYSPWAGGGRGFARAHVYNEKGKLIASISQEAIIRRRKAKV